MAEEGKGVETHKALDDFDPPKKPKTNFYAFGCAILASTTCILLGYDIGVMTGAAIYIKKDLKVSDVKIEILLGIINLYSLIGSCLAGRTSDWIGRRYTIVFAGTIFFAGAILMGFSPNYAFLMFGRFVAGIGIGYALMIGPVYSAEVSPASYRGFLTSFTDAFINGGILLGYISNFAFSKMTLKLGWRMMLGVGAIPSALITLGVLAMPESPRWLVMNGRLGEAAKVLNKTSDSKEEAQLRLAEIKQAAGIPESCNDDVVQVTKQSTGKDVWKELFLYPTPAVRHIVIAALGIYCFQQASGVDAIVLYSPRIFQNAGMTDDTHTLLATVAVGFVKTLFIVLSSLVLDRVGRRPMLLSSVAGMMVSLLTLGIGFTIIERSESKPMWGIGLSIAMVLAFVATFSIGAGPITWVYSAEVFPLRLRAQGVAAGVVVNRVSSGVVTMTFLSLTKAITFGGTFFLYSGVAVIGWLFFYFALPETRGKTLEEMEGSFGHFGGKSNSKNKGVENGNGRVPQVQLGTNLST
ncbi:MFS transporter [Vigna unguiculata]|uniref:MFS transporter n=2 Tax=Vigna unguiculata TaxID=3917 RepID=A0A4D6LJ34_VIGUN|nr:MFS transporter [Vigna unguiculata]